MVSPRREHGSFLSFLPALAMAALPKCPMCLAVYGGFMASLGSSSWLAAIWGLPLTAAALLGALGALAFRARQRRQYGPLLLGVTGAVTLLTGKFLFDTPCALYTGAPLLAVASVWSAAAARGPRQAA